MPTPTASTPTDPTYPVIGQPVQLIGLNPLAPQAGVITAIDLANPDHPVSTVTVFPPGAAPTSLTSIYNCSGKAGPVCWVPLP